GEKARRTGPSSPTSRKAAAARTTGMASSIRPRPGRAASLVPDRSLAEAITSLWCTPRGGATIGHGPRPRPSLAPDDDRLAPPSPVHEQQRGADRRPPRRSLAG